MSDIWRGLPFQGSGAHRVLYLTKLTEMYHIFRSSSVALTIWVHTMQIVLKIKKNTEMFPNFSLKLFSKIWLKSRDKKMKLFPVQIYTVHVKAEQLNTFKIWVPNSLTTKVWWSLQIFVATYLSIFVRTHLNIYLFILIY